MAQGTSGQGRRLVRAFPGDMRAANYTCKVLRCDSERARRTRSAEPAGASNRQLAQFLAGFGPFPDLPEILQQLGMATRCIGDDFTVKARAERAEIEPMAVVEDES